MWGVSGASATQDSLSVVFGKGGGGGGLEMVFNVGTRGAVGAGEGGGERWQGGGRAGGGEEARSGFLSDDRALRVWEGLEIDAGGLGGG